PNAAVPVQDYAIAMHASSLVVDGGTLQIGIGSLGDAVAHCCILRHEHNKDYADLLAALSAGQATAAQALGRFDEGLYVSTEMFVNGMMHLVDRGIVKRRVYDDLFLQRALNAGDIADVIDHRFFEHALAEGWLCARLDERALDKLRYWGAIDATVSLSGDGLVINGTQVANDLSDPQTLEALLSVAEGRALANGRYLHGGFFLGPADFYGKLRSLDDDARQSICMTGVRRTNQLLLDYPLYSAQRRDARFINTGMMVSLNGCVASDALEDGTVISGVGGQYNFVAMAHDLPGARSVLCFRSTRGHGKGLQSNIVPHYGYATIPKHLRDIVITEYGIADLRGQSDAEVIKRLVNIADARFQDELLDYAKAHHKLPADYEVPAWARNNTPERIAGTLHSARESNLLPDYPFGTDLTDEELALAASLRRIKALSEEPTHFVGRAFRALLHRENEEAARPYLERIHLEHPETPRDFLIQQLLLLDLEERGLLKVS
ncbi:MAG: acetyl-CoA hydrolase/transferase C-terminal domain-containing protein, partial [Halioglobus sp.]